MKILLVLMLASLVLVSAPIAGACAAQKDAAGCGGHNEKTGVMGVNTGPPKIGPAATPKVCPLVSPQATQQQATQAPVEMAFAAAEVFDVVRVADRQLLWGPTTDVQACKNLASRMGPSYACIQVRNR